MNIYIFGQRVWRHTPDRLKAFIRSSELLDLVKRRIHSAIRKTDPHNSIYNDSYFAGVEREAAPSAAGIASSIHELLHPTSVVDVGCGTGAVLKQLIALGVPVFGVDFSESSINICLRRGLSVARCDLESQDLPPRAVGDVFLCAEVAEHIPDRCADRLVRNLSRAGHFVVFTAAPPGQADIAHHDHVNEQPPEYWIGKFVAYGFQLDLRLTELFRERWRATEVSWFYVRNVMIFQRFAGGTTSPE